LCTEQFYAIIPTLFPCFCWSAIPIPCYIFVSAPECQDIVLEV